MSDIKGASIPDGSGRKAGILYQETEQEEGEKTGEKPDRQEPGKEDRKRERGLANYEPFRYNRKQRVKRGEDTYEEKCYCGSVRRPHSSNQCQPLRGDSGRE